MPPGTAKLVTSPSAPTVDEPTSVVPFAACICIAAYSAWLCVQAFTSKMVRREYPRPLAAGRVAKTELVVTSVVSRHIGLGRSNHAVGTPRVLARRAAICHPVPWG